MIPLSHEFTQKLKLLQNSKTQIGTLTNQIVTQNNISCDKLKK